MDNLFLKGYEAAKAAGLSDEKIVADLTRHPVYGPAIRQSQEGGLSVGAIMTGLKSGSLEQMAKPDLPERSRFEAFGRGMEDVTSGLTSLLPFGYGDKYTEAAADRAKVYDRANQGVGFDGGRVVGQVAALSPLMMVSPKASASTLQRVGTNAAVGGVAGFIPREDSLGQRLTNAAVGTVLGGTVPEVVRAGIGAGSKLVRNIKSKVADVTPAVEAAISSVDQEAARVTQSQAPALITSQADDAAIGQTREYLAQLATQQLKATGKIDQAALNRAAQVTAVNPNLRPTLGQLTRDPAVYSAEKNLMKSGTEAGNLVSKRFQEQESVLRESAKEMVDRTGGEPLTDYAYGGKAGGVLRDKWAAMQKQVGKLYDEAEAAGGDAPALNADDIANLFENEAVQSLDAGSAGVSHSIGKIKARMAKLGIVDGDGNVVRDMTMADANNLRKFIGGIDSSDPAIFAMKRSLIEGLDSAAEAKPGFEAFRTARAAAKARFDEFTDRTLAKVKTDKIPDEKLFDLATGRNVDTAKDYVKALTTGTPEQMAAGEGVLKDTQRKLLAQVLAKGQRGPMGEEAFYPASLRNALNPDLNGYQPEVLGAVLTPEQVGGLRNFAQVVDILRADPAHNSINQSGSGALLAGLMNGGEAALVNRLGSVSDAAPGVIGGAVRGAIGASKDAQQQALAKALLSGNPAAVPGMDEAVLQSILSPNSPTKAALIRALMQGPGLTGSAAVTGNQ